jgi:hypothetical protein
MKQSVMVREYVRAGWRIERKLKVSEKQNPNNWENGMGKAERERSGRRAEQKDNKGTNSKMPQSADIENRMKKQGARKKEKKKHTQQSRWRKEMGGQVRGHTPKKHWWK